MAVGANVAERDETILAVGAAGHYGGLIVPMLAERGFKVRGFVRSEEKGRQAIRNGATDFAVGDLRDSASVATAMQGVSGVFYIAPVYPGDESQRVGKSLIENAKRASVRKFVFSSVIHSMLTALDNHIQKIPVEEALIQSGMDFTILRPCHLHQNIARRWPMIVERRMFAEPFSAQSRLSRVDYRDVAEVAAKAFTSDDLANGTFELCADGGHNRHQVAALMSEVLGYRIEAGELDLQEWLSALPFAQDDYTRDALARLNTYYDRHGLIGNPITLRAVLGREPRSLKQFLCDLRDGVPTMSAQ